MINRGSTPILTHLVGVYTWNIFIKLEANPCSGSREKSRKTEKVHADDNDDGHRVIAIVTHPLSVT